MMLFKIWDSTRTKKFFVAVDETCSNTYETLILKASEKMSLNGSVLVLESDGTQVDEDDTLKLLHNETFILLQPNESWRSANTSGSLADTISVQNSENLSLNLSVSSDNSVSQAMPATDIANNLKEVSDTNLPSPSAISENNLERMNEESWLSFLIPWNKLPSSVLKNCESGNKDQRSITAVVQLVADSMVELKKDNNIPSKAIRIVAHKLVSKYPKIFQDIDDDGIVMGDGSVIIYNKLKERIKYLNRSGKRKYNNCDVPIKYKKKMLSSRAGCHNWQPAMSTEPNEDIQNSLKEIDFTTFNEEIEAMLEKTYSLQRQFLNHADAPSVIDIKREWPILLSEHGIQWHYKKLMNNQNINILIENMIIKSERIINFGMSKKLISLEKPKTEDEKLMTVLKVITGFFKEKYNVMCCQLKEESDLEDSVMNSPFICVISEEDGKKFLVVFEREKVHESQSFATALKLTFALYYVFNLEYPKEASNTYEVLQRYFLKIHPDQGTKNKSQHSKTKVISFLNKLRNFLN